MSGQHMQVSAGTQELAGTGTKISRSLSPHRRMCVFVQFMEAMPVHVPSKQSSPGMLGFAGGGLNLSPTQG